MAVAHTHTHTRTSSYLTLPHAPCPETLTHTHTHIHIYTHAQLDVPEDVFSGLELAGGMDWGSRVRVIIHAGDAPQHGQAFHDFGPQQ